MSQRIPRRLHFIWWQETITEPVKNNLERWRALNPKWEIRVWTESMITAFVQQHFPALAGAFKRIPKTTARDKFREIRKVDCARLLILHRLGGAYFDVDLVPQRPLDCFLNDRVIYLRRYDRFDPKAPVNLADIMQADHIAPAGYDYLVFRDTRKMDDHGAAIINGALFSKAHDHGEQSWLLDFAKDRLTWSNRRKPVLQAFGPHALAHHLRALKRAEANAVQPTRLLVVPGHYVVWDDYMFGPHWWFVLTTHDGKTGAQSWGDDRHAEPWRDTR